MDELIKAHLPCEPYPDRAYVVEEDAVRDVQIVGYDVLLVNLRDRKLLGGGIVPESIDIVQISRIHGIIVGPTFG